MLMARSKSKSRQHHIPHCYLSGTLYYIGLLLRQVMFRNSYSMSLVATLKYAMFEFPLENQIQIKSMESQSDGMKSSG